MRRAKQPTKQEKRERVESILSELEKSRSPESGVFAPDAPERSCRVSRGVKNHAGNSTETHPEPNPYSDPIRQTMCDGKICYANKRDALTKKNFIRKSRGVFLREYHCHYCNGYHLTKSL